MITRRSIFKTLALTPFGFLFTKEEMQKKLLWTFTDDGDEYAYNGVILRGSKQAVLKHIVKDWIKRNPEDDLCVGWEGFYEVSDAGGVRSVARSVIQGNGHVQTFQSTELRGSLNSSGYPVVHLRDTIGKRNKTILVHRLVAIAFIENPNGKRNINHRDFDILNAAVANLEWCTQAENLAYSMAHGRMPNDHWRGKRTPSALLSDATVAEIRAAHSCGDVSLGKLSQRFKVSKRTIGRIVNGESYPPPSASSATTTEHT